METVFLAFLACPALPSAALSQRGIEQFATAHSVLQRTMDGLAQYLVAMRHSASHPCCARHASGGLCAAGQAQ